MGLSPNIRIYRYKPKQFFDAHCMLNWSKHHSCFLSPLIQTCCSVIWLPRADHLVQPASVSAIFNEPGWIRGPAETQVGSTNARNCR